MYAKPDEQKFYDIAVCDFGSGPFLITIGGGATTVLIAGVRGPGRARIEACDADCRLTPEAGLAVLQDIATLWNERAARLRALRDGPGTSKTMAWNGGSHS